MNVMALPGFARTPASGPGSAAAADSAEELMTRRQVAMLFGVTSAAVATWARRGRLPEVRNEDGRPRYRRAEVEALFRSSLRRRAR
jgi:MerR HTH family regulatory protein